MANTQQQTTTVTQTEYARMKGVSHTAVKHAIQTGRLTKSVIYLQNGTKRIDPKIADKEWVENTDPRHWRANYSTKGGSKATAVDKDGAADNGTLANAKKALAVYKAKLAELEYKEKEGSLVDKKMVYDTLFKWGKELREKLLAIPDRVTDGMISAKTRNEAFTLLYDELAETLEKETSQLDRPITSR